MSINNTSTNLFKKLQDNGFKVIGKYIHKRSTSSNKLKVVGQINEKNFFFYSENVYPFKAGVNFLNENIKEENAYELKEYYTKIKENERNDFNTSFENYVRTTKTNSIFLEWLNITSRKYKSKFSENYFDIRGISKGYLEGATLFPFFDYDNNFITAQIIKYDDKGKRIKSSFSTNWYHSYKPIKRDLGFKDNDTFSVSIPCFFGENYLNGSDNIVAIVEAPKTAVILKELYPNIDWIATAGEQTLFNKNLDVLKDKKVVLFPDAHTTSWKEFAKTKGFYCSDILERKDISPGDDLADYIFDSQSTVYSELHEHLFGLNLGEFDFKINADSLTFDYKIKGFNTNYFITVPTYYKGHKVLNQIDNAKDFDVKFKGNKFDLYSEKYDLYIAQIDWHRPILRKNGDLVRPTQKDFTYNLQQCFRILKELNPKIYKGIFTEVVKKFRDSNYSFNEKYILERLVPFWDSWNRDLEVFKKQRDWKFKGGNSLTRDNFVKELNNHRFQYKSKLILEDLYSVLSENRFIDTNTDLSLSKGMRGFSKIKSIVSAWNESVIGCKTLKTYFNKLEFKRQINDNVKSVPPYIKDVICSGTNFTLSNLSISDAMKLTGNKNNKAVKSFLSFIPNEKARTSIFDEVYLLLNDVKNIVPIRQKIGDTTRIYDFEVVDYKIENSDSLNNHILPSDAFKILGELKDLELQLLTDDEYAHLCLLEEINSFSYFKRREVLNNITQRSLLLNKFKDYKFKVENTDVQTVLKIA
jgi:hypothetical protein